jgi:hypothetical protein
VRLGTVADARLLLTAPIRMSRTGLVNVEGWISEPLQISPDPLPRVSLLRRLWLWLLALPRLRQQLGLEGLPDLEPVLELPLTPPHPTRRDPADLLSLHPHTELAVVVLPDGTNRVQAGMEFATPLLGGLLTAASQVTFKEYKEQPRRIFIAILLAFCLQLL